LFYKDAPEEPEEGEEGEQQQSAEAEEQDAGQPEAGRWYRGMVWWFTPKMANYKVSCGLPAARKVADEQISAQCRARLALCSI
jgi:hypothetical protein